MSARGEVKRGLLALLLGSVLILGGMLLVGCGPTQGISSEETKAAPTCTMERFSPSPMNWEDTDVVRGCPFERHPDGSLTLGFADGYAELAVTLLHSDAGNYIVDHATVNKYVGTCDDEDDWKGAVTLFRGVGEHAADWDIYVDLKCGDELGKELQARVLYGEPGAGAGL